MVMAAGQAANAAPGSVSGAAPGAMSGTVSEMTAVQSVCGLDVQDRDSAESPSFARQNAPNTQGHIVHPVSASLQALVTSAQEWSALLRGENYRPERTAGSVINLLQSADDSSASAELAESSSYQVQEIQCMALKEAPSSAPIAPTAEEPKDEIPFLEPATGSAPAVELTPAVPTEEPIAPAVPDVAEPATPVAPITPAMPSVAAPDADPFNFTPDDAAPTPFSGIVVPPLSALPDGSYRYLAGNYEYGVYTDEQLAANGGAVFLLTKRGNEVTGYLRPRIDRPGICVTGLVGGNSVVGAAYPDEAIAPQANTADVSSAAAGNAYTPFAGLSSLQVRQPRTVADRTYYADAKLDLSEYSRINAGAAIAPTECELPASDIDADTEMAE